MSIQVASPSEKQFAVWAINPFELETRPQPAVIEELRGWAERNGMAIQPVHVLYVPTVDLPAQERGEWLGRYIPAIEAEMSNYLRGMNLPNLRRPEVLLQQGGSTEEAVDTLTAYIAEKGASWVLVSSKGRSGLRRLALGSFAERLLLKSTVPVWVFGHESPATLDSSRILFATDFTDASRSVFGQVLTEARRMGSKVTLFHCVNLPQGMMSGVGVMGMSAYIPADTYLDDQTEWAKGVADDWIKDAALAGVSADFVVLQATPNIANSIVQQAELLGAGVIALASRSGPMSAALLGSHARQVIRQAKCPVWVFGPKCPEEAKKAGPARELNAG